MLEETLRQFSFGGNWVDLIFFLVLFYFIATNRGGLATLLEVVGFGFSLFFSYKLYAFFGRFLSANFSLPRGLSNASGFFIAWFFSELIYFPAIYAVYPVKQALQKVAKKPANVAFGFLAGAVQGAVVFLFVVSLVFALPVRGQIKKAVLDSKTGPFFVGLSQGFERGLKEAFGEAAQETLNFLTIHPGSTQRVDLGFETAKKQLAVDPQSEAAMLELVNRERVAAQVAPLSPDEALQKVARRYAEEMLRYGFFSHISVVDGSDAGDRVLRAGIAYTILGENLAYAPDVYVAHQGLMNSEGHRKNILLSDYGRVGIGVVDGGIYGKMFVQLFSN
ncbi:CvpA family protein [Candidatus Roizmanbacteria bacterium]|nr:CvpA family protein [Candidatus Roizmanbacteria bacterium]